jgi:hypothetical protein
MAIYGAYLSPEEAEEAELIAALNRERKADPERTAEEILSFVLSLKNNWEIPFGPLQEQSLGTIIDRTLDDDLTSYFNLSDKIHADGYINPAVQDAIVEEQAKHSGLSAFNDNLRQTVFGYFAQLAKGLGTSEADYLEWYDITGKQFPAYIKVFGNESFNQQLRSLSRDYTRRLIKVHTNKRGKDYRDIKKTTMTTWVQYGFMSDKQLKEFFKTPRKKKPVTE